MLVALTVATIATVALIVVLATGSWWALPIAMAGHLVALVVVMRPIYRAMGQQDKPDPVTEARLEEEGRGPAGDREQQPLGTSSASDAPTEGDEPRMAI